VSAVLNFGAGDILEIKPVSGEPLLVPFTDTTVPDIDMKAGRMVVVPPATVE
jgi:16S rRNA processing protein RimM